MRILLLMCCVAIAPVAWADSATSSFRVGLTVVRSPQQVAASVARQQELLAAVSLACIRERRHVVHIDWVSDHLRRQRDAARIDCTVADSGEPVVSVIF
ncbi:hypothetical protein [Lysobacter sp. F6437]|uniref:hypothetical protein n=1 Tax=Lysobacter sp. F6437 TaxID=3459296 RepID=UPI00403D6EEB